ncbi:MAG: hypothetical protein KC731_37160 [Myxococcales bacterium]|nr:hypothetical protein [Myxococcales bacterium]
MASTLRRRALGAGALGLLGIAGSGHAAESPHPPGESIDYAWDGRSAGHPELAWMGRAYLSPIAARAKGPLPLLVFLHGLNKALIPHRWMGGGQEGDLRRIVGDLVDVERVAPLVVAAPTSVVASQVSRGASFDRFDLEHFLAETERALASTVAIDRRRILVAGHSGAGCSTAGGLATAPYGKQPLHAVMAIDTCMAPSLAVALARSPEATQVIVTYQRLGWGSRPFTEFERAFTREVAAHPSPSTRVLEELHPRRAYHDRTVHLTLERWLPRLLPPSVTEP